MPEFIGSVVSYPARASFFWYLLAIAVGAGLLTLPICGVEEKVPISVLDAAFTATSAGCVTGLAVRSTGNDFSIYGQLVILALIQLGGIGIMTVTTLVTFRLGGRENLRHRAAIGETLGGFAEANPRWVLRRVVQTTLIFESAGFLVLAARNLIAGGPSLTVPQALWHALFHSVSAFCNAGFALWDDSLVRYQSDPLINITMMLLIITGGIGFPVMFDLRRNWNGPWRDRWDRLHLHTKMMLIGTTALLVLGTAAILAIEWDDALREFSWPTKLMMATFQSVTCRTAGFNTVDIATLTNASLFIMILLMMIGGGPCSTAGGFKVSTMMVLVVRAWTTFHGHDRVNLFRRTIPNSLFARATTTAFLFGVISFMALTTLLIIEQSRGGHTTSQGLFLDALFEVISALGTVGLSAGLTTKLTALGKIVMILLMFMGRLGPISVFAVLSRTAREDRIEFPPEEPLIG